MRTVERILGAAAEEFALRGFHEVTLLDIAERARVTKGAVYFHYANKEEIAFSVTRNFHARLEELLDRVRAMDLPPLDRLAELCVAVAVLLADDRVVQAAVRLQIDLLEGGSFPAPCGRFNEAARELLLEAGRGGHLDAASDPEVVARVLAGAFYGVQHVSWVLNDRADVVERVQELVDVVLRRTARP